MNIFKKTKVTKVVAVFAGLMTAVMMLGGVAVLPASAATAAELQAQIQALLAQVAALQAQTGGTTVSSSCPVAYTFPAMNLKLGSKGEAVWNAQKVMNLNAGTMVALSGAGSSGMETMTFGPLTKRAVTKFQEFYAADILAPLGLSAGTGTVGPSTRAKMQSVLDAAVAACTAPSTGGTTTGGTSTGGTTTGGTTTGGTTAVAGSLAVAPGTQPANSLAPQSAARLPYTRVTFTAGASDVVVNGITVERAGLAQDVVFAGVSLLDENGIQLGIAKTLNSNHQAIVGEPFTVKAGTSRTMTIAGNMAASLANYAGQVATLKVVGVNTTAAVSGNLPIEGAQHTVNATLSMGSATLVVSSYDPNGAQTKNVGDVNMKFAGLKMTTGSTEKVYLHSIRWNQSGSAASGDLANLKTYIDGTAYDTVVSADGKYFTSTFGASGILVDKGFSKDIWIQGDIVGSGVAGRTVQFDLYKTTDIYMSGETYGYGITPTPGGNTAAAATTGSQFVTSDGTTSGTAGTPWYSGSTFTVNAGTVSSVQKANSVAAANVAVGLANTILGGYEVNLKGEPISVQQSIFRYSTTTAAAFLITNITITDQNGKVVAGPVDAIVDTSSPSKGKATFTDTITYPTGVSVYTIKGKVPTTAGNNATITFETTPSTDWSTITGQTTGNSISLSSLSGLVQTNAQTVKAASIAVTVSGTPAAQTLTTGSNKHLATINLSTTASGEGVKFSSIVLGLIGNLTATTTQLTTCGLYDGDATTPLNGTSVTPAATDTTMTFSFDNALIVPKGITKNLKARCNVSSVGTSAKFVQIGVASGTGSSVISSATGVDSSASATVTSTLNNGQAMTFGTASYTVVLDSNMAYKSVEAGTTGVTAAALKFTASNDAIDVDKLALILTNSASSSQSDLTKVTVYDAAGQKLAEDIFTSDAYTKQLTLSPRLHVNKDASATLTVKVDTATIDSNTASSREGAFIAVNYDNGATNATTAYGSDGAVATDSSTADTASSGFRMFKAVPTVVVKTTTTTCPDLATNYRSGVASADKVLYCFTVSGGGATTNGVSLREFVMNIATSTNSLAAGSTTVTSLYAKAYDENGSVITNANWTSDRFVTAISALLASGDNVMAAATTPLMIPAGKTYTVKVYGTVTHVDGTDTGVAGSVIAKMKQDSSWMSSATKMIAYTTAMSNFIWSPNSTTTTPGNGHVDWGNGYGITGAWGTYAPEYAIGVVQ